MKNITPISIWDKGTVQEASVLNTYANYVQLNNTASFVWVLFSTVNGNINNQLSQGNLNMSAEDYAKWNADEFAWDWIAAQLNLTITGDYVPPVPPVPGPPVEPTTTTTSTTTENVVID
jgi:hypothetical protein